MWKRKTVSLGLFDTVGQEDYDRLRPSIYPDTNVFLVCFSVVIPSSFAHVKTKWIHELKHHAPGVPFVLVGTQIDLREDNEEMLNQHISPVSKEMGNKLKSEIGAFAYRECSARTQKGLVEVFNTAIESVFTPKEEKKKEGGCLLL
jgi:small GTP-binding protein